MTDDNPQTDEPDIRQKLNLETGKISWPELQRYFAGGRVIIVERDLDLIDTATLLVEDSSAEMEKLVAQGRIVRATDEHAIRWQDTDPLFWAVVVAPWVLVQEISD